MYLEHYERVPVYNYLNGTMIVNDIYISFSCSLLVVFVFKHTSVCTVPQIQAPVPAVQSVTQKHNLH